MMKFSFKELRENIDQLPSSNELIVFDVPQYLNHKIGLEPNNRFITILIQCNNKDNKLFSPVLGKYISISYDNAIEVSYKGKTEYLENYTVLILKSKDLDIENYFLELMVLFVNKLGNHPEIENVISEYEKIESIFTKLSKNSTASVLGLWGELVAILLSNDPKNLIETWHIDKNSKFDFSNGIDRLEIKTTIQARRKHSFEVKQLIPPVGVEIFIGSIMTNQIDSGKSIRDLIELIQLKIDTSSYEKLLIKTFEVLGDRINETFELRYDYNLAKNTFVLYKSNVIPRPEIIPNEVSEVKFQVDLENIDCVPISNYTKSFLLFYK